ncbi:MAG: Gfo/Idh/MocA family oxidoreductase [Anaerovorax sp.]
MNKVKFAIIGCGRIAKNHVKAAIDNAESMQLVAVCDIIKENAIEKATQYAEGHRAQPSVYVDYKEMLEKEEIDAVTICTESGYHPEIAIYSMNQGKHVITEKPMALSVEDADAMIHAGQANRVKLCVSHQNRFNPPIQKLREAVEKGRFGRLIAGNARILWNRNQGYYSQAPWRGTYQLDGGCLMNQCIHNIDLLQWMLGGDIDWVNGAVGNFMHDYIAAEDYGSIQLGLKEGIIGNVEGTVCVYPTNLEETLTIMGEKGIVAIGGVAVNKIETWRFADGLDTEEEVMTLCNGEVESVYGNGHTPLYRDFIDAIENDRKPYIDGKDGKIAMQIILAAYKSSMEGRRISWEKDCSCLKAIDGGVR